MALSPNYAESHDSAGVLERDLGDMERAILHYECCAALDETSTMAAQNRSHALKYTDLWSPSRVYEEHACSWHARWGCLFQTRA